MANNRMFLIHIPTGKAVFLAKRMVKGWYKVSENLKDQLELLFSSVEDDIEGQDNFAVGMEISDGEYVCTNWDYTDVLQPLRILNIKK